MTLVGRNRELAYAHAAIDQALVGDSTLLRIIGEAGIGKSSLVEALTHKLRRDGLRVLRATASRAEQGLPFALLMELSEEALTTNEVVEALNSYDIADLAHAFPEMRKLQEPGTSSDFSTVLVCRAFGKAVQAYAHNSNGLAIVVDDLQWADAATATVLDYLTRHPPSLPLLMITAARPGPHSGDVGSDLAAGRMALKELFLAPLPESAVAPLVAAAPRESRRSIVQMAGGNPFYLKELAAAAGRAASTGRDAMLGGFDGSAARRLIAAELADSSQNGREVACLASVVGDPFSAETIVSVSGLSRDDALAAIDELIESRLITPTDRPGVLRFRHPLVGSAVYESMPTGQRLGAHRAVADHLLAHGASALDVAAHIEIIASPTDEASIELLVAAVEQARFTDPANASRLAALVLKLLPDDRTTLDTRGAVKLSRVLSLVLADEPALALAEIAREFDDVATGRSERTELAVNLPYVLYSLELHNFDVPAEYGAMIEDSLGLVERAARSAEDPRAMFHIIVWDVRAGNIDSARDLGERLMQPGPRRHLASALRSATLLCCVEAQLGNVESATRLLAIADELFAEFGAPELHGVQDATYLLCVAAQQLGNWRRSTSVGEIGLSNAAKTGSLAFSIGFACVSTQPLLSLGEIETAMSMIEMAVEQAMTSQNEALLGNALALHAAGLCLTADRATAEAQAHRAHAHMPLVPWARNRAGGEVALAGAWMLLGDADRAFAAAESGTASEDFVKLGLIERTKAHSIAAWSARVRGDLSALTEACVQANAIAIAQIPASMYWLLRARAEESQAAGRVTETRALLREAVDAADESECHLERALTQIRLADVLIDSGDDASETISLLSSAHRSLQEYGAVTMAKLAEDRLEQLGHPVANVPSANATFPELSAREEQIARLVSAGSTNRDVAAQLFLSVRTVDSHVRRIFSKLDVHNRAQLAALVQARDLSR